MKVFASMSVCVPREGVIRLHSLKHDQLFWVPSFEFVANHLSCVWSYRSSWFSREPLWRKSLFLFFFNCEISLDPVNYLEIKQSLISIHTQAKLQYELPRFSAILYVENFRRLKTNTQKNNFVTVTNGQPWSSDDYLCRDAQTNRR